MCGIAGLWGNVSTGRLRAMTDALRHRGPDDEGLWIDPGAGRSGDLGHAGGDAEKGQAAGRTLGLAHGLGIGQRRLSIIDLAGGHQPIFNETGRVATVFNGEIYNYKELREELLARGHTLTTNSDTETIVHLYEEMGPELFTKLRGMFAIAVWDAEKQILVLARDRAGKKPLYYAELGGEFLFASEIKGVVASMPTPLTIDQQALADYLAWGEIHAPATIYKQIRSLEPGEWAVVRERRITRRQRYWRLAMLPKVVITPEEAVERTDALIREAVTLRLRSDVPVGCFLSGGIDSGIVTAMAAQQYPGRLTTVTIGFEQGSFDERPLAKLVAERYNTDHHEVLVKTDVVNDLAKIAAAYDQPFGGPSAVPSYYVARAARQFVKVVMNGDGGDEVFAGYRRYVAARMNGWLSWVDGSVFRPAWRLLNRMMPTPSQFRSGYAFAHRFVRGMGMGQVERYLAWSLDLLPENEKRELCGLNGAGTGGTGGRGNEWIAATQPGGRLAEPFLRELAACGPVDRMLGADFCTILPNDLLVKMDIACMAHSLEGRSPLLDHVMIDAVSKFPESIKLAGKTTKPLLRKLGERYLPAEILAAPKRGFEVPLVDWLRGELKPMCADVVRSRNGLLADMFDRAALERLVDERDGLDPRRWARRMWTMLMLGLWDEHVRPKCRPAIAGS